MVALVDDHELKVLRAETTQKVAAGRALYGRENVVPSDRLIAASE